MKLSSSFAGSSICSSMFVGAIQRPRTSSAAARQVSNAHRRDLVTNKNVWLGPFGSNVPFGKSFSLSSREQLPVATCKLDRKKDFPKRHV